MLREALLTRFSPAYCVAAGLLSDLPAYQVALWPDGWDLEPDGSVRVRDTHAMAEARRWYLLADRNRARDDASRVMALHGIFVPRPIVDMAQRRFPSERVASVAMQLVAGDWIKLRRRQLLESPNASLVDRSLGWSGSRHDSELGEGCLLARVGELLRACIAERLIPDADYSVGIRAGRGYGITGYRCSLEVRLDPCERARVREVLLCALLPWNRAVVRDGVSCLLIEIGRAGGARGRLI